jgi:DNA-binding NtrC family response regulator
MPSLAASATEQRGWNLDNCLSYCEREIVKAAMRRSSNNQSKAARLLGLTPRGIYNKLRKHELLRKPMS